MCENNYGVKGKHLDLTGKKFGRLTVLHRKEKENQKERAKWVCQCDCGNTTEVQTYFLTSGITKSCGCLQKDIVRARKQLKETDLTLLHKKLNMLEVIGFDGYKLICKCDCGNTIKLFPSRFLTGQTKSCGCLKASTSSKNMKKAAKSTIKDNTNIPKMLSHKPSKSNKTTGIKGVFRNKKGKYVASIGFQHKKIYLGTYSTLIEAKKAREEAEEKYFKPILEKYNKVD